jgi:hypothetical protein
MAQPCVMASAAARTVPPTCRRMGCSTCLSTRDMGSRASGANSVTCRRKGAAQGHEQGTSTQAAATVGLVGHFGHLQACREPHVWGKLLVSECDMKSSAGLCV